MSATGRSSRTWATMLFVVPRSIPIGFGGALGSKMSSRAMVLQELVFVGRGFVEEATVVAELAERAHQRVGIESPRRGFRSVTVFGFARGRELSAQAAQDRHFAGFHFFDELGQALYVLAVGRFGELFTELHHFHQELGVGFWLLALF